VFLGTGCVHAQTAAWRDPAPHREGFVQVERDVRLHYLDFGGAGEPLVFLAGIGNTAHAYDDFAPAFTDRFRVVAITRRGFGQSTHPDSGYALTRLGDDVIAVLDSLKLERVHLVGHSFAGQEMTYLAHRFPQRLRKLVYLDGAFDYFTADSANTAVFTEAYDWPSKPPLEEADTATIEAYMAYVRRSRGVSIPEADTRARVTADGFVEEMAAPYLAIASGQFERQRWDELRVPALAIFAVYDSPTQMEPWLRAQTEWHRRVQRVLDRRRRVDEALERDFRRAPNSRSLVVRGGHHWIFLSHRDQVLRATREFLLAP
jgi:pimeloyl-ACP methyl ester carboxylesterase